MSASFATHVQCAFLTLVLCSNLFTATFCLSFFKAEPHVSCNEKEKQALLTLKRGLTNPGNLLASWSDQEDCCRWERVRCDSKTGRVTELHLSCPLDADGSFYDKKRLGGEISPSLLELGFLNYLDLSGDDFNRTHIPSFLGSMGSLTHLDLHWANFSGLIPHQLGNLSGLRYLDLSGNDFNRAGIPSFLGSMDSLRHLDLHSANFSGLIPHQLGNLSGLRYLDLRGYSDLYVDTLHWMSGLSSIQYLGLSSVDLHREVDWLQIMSKFPSLLKLFLNNCQLDSMNQSLGTLNFTSLQVLDLSENNFNHEMPNWFSNLSTALLELYLDDSSLKGEIPESLGQLKHLTDLDLSSNSFSGPIPSSLGNLSEMRVLNLQGNQLNGSVPKSLGLLSNLVALVIGYNVLTGTLDEAHFTKLSKLKVLDISSTPLFFNVNSNWVPPFQLEFAYTSSCKIGPNFPTWLHTQRSLQVLLMSMSGISDKAPSWFWNWTSNIDTIDLSDNHIEGDVPDILLNSTVLNLRSNRFKGRLPRLSANVKVLNIANNSIYGPISTFLCQKMNRKNKLEVLDVSNNFLSGEISHCWRYWQSLIHLNLGTNSLSGKIPYSMGSLVNLMSLSLQNNSFSGDIPSSLKKCSSLGLIDIGDNHLSGIIPLWVRKMRNLIILRLRSSGFKGKIPPKICQLSSLRILDLANNSLSGPIPNCLKNFSAMVLPDSLGDFYFPSLEYGFDYGSYIESLMLVPKGWELKYEGNLKFVRIIDLSSNNLSGSIPDEISVLSELHFLNFSRNHLMGSIPEKIGSMKQLESIDLSRNLLSGEIPPSMSNLSSLSYLDLSYNDLSGKIPSSTQLQSFDALRYTGNPQLCGDPLPNDCNESFHNRTSIGKTEDDSENSSLYMGMGVGFAVGFWAVCGSLLFNRTWRHAYFKFLNDIKDWLYVATVLKMNWLLEKLRSCHLC